MPLSTVRASGTGLIARFVVALLAVFLMQQGLRAQQPVRADAVRLTATPNGAMLQIDFSDEVPFETSAMSLPDRLIVDLPKVMFSAGDGKSVGKNGPVSAFRYGLFFADRSRIVMDLSEPALIERVETIRVDGRFRVQAHVVKVNRQKFAEAALARKPPAPVAVAVEPPAQAEGPRQLPLVMIDPGHGGIDPGASAASGDNEKGIVLALAQSVAERLEKAGLVRVALTRNEDVFVSLGDRVRIARDKKAALMISIHADTIPYEAGVRGASVYTLSERASDVISARLADSENRVDQLAGVEVREEADAIGDILFDLTKRETRHFSQGAAKHIVSSIGSSTALHKYPLKAAGFRVLTAPDVPSVLIEAGYLSSVDDARQMKSPEWRASMAEAIASAVEKYFGENATRVTNSTSRP